MIESNFLDRSMEFSRKIRNLENAPMSFDYESPRVRNPDGGVGGDSPLFSFKATASGDLSATMLAGGITLGPFTRIEWGSITSASLDITVDDATAAWWVWMSIDVRDGAEAAEWHEGADMATYYSSLTDDEKKYTMIVPLVYITASDKAVSPDPASWSIDEVKNLQCGDILIPRL